MSEKSSAAGGAARVAQGLPQSRQKSVSHRRPELGLVPDALKNVKELRIPLLTVPSSPSSVL